MLGQATDHRFPVERHAPGSLAAISLGVLFAFKSRTNFIANVVRDLTTNVRDFSAMNLQ
ncbi:MAG: hypothetical protein QOJ42_6972 [Acidobacteriaceae bacterium]|jgi:hypothetical protein|nr:hypothetical protein [Acidobacteriaceae bacterium]